MLRDWLRKSQTWVKFQHINREGWRQAFKRRNIQRVILKTAPVKTADKGDREVRILTWRRGCFDAIWALKSFYAVADADYPLHIHDGGLESWQFKLLLEHFPNARLIPKSQADELVEADLRTGHLTRSLEYRRHNITSLKVWDFFLLSKADHVISIDSDIVFFKKPTELLSNSVVNLYNKDMQYAYSMGVDELEMAFGVRPPPLINSGLSLVKRESMRFDSIELWLNNEQLFADKWVTEQTLHALCSTLYGVQLLPETYCVSEEPGLRSDCVCKHYPGFFRPLLYNEGMRHLLDLELLKFTGDVASVALRGR